MSTAEWTDMVCASCGDVWRVLAYPDCPELFWCCLCGIGVEEAR
jgi:hypothetical protein